MASFSGFRPVIMQGDPVDPTDPNAPPPTDGPFVDPTPNAPGPEAMPGMYDASPSGQDWRSAILGGMRGDTGTSAGGFGGSLANQNAYHLVDNDDPNLITVVYDNGQEYTFPKTEKAKFLAAANKAGMGGVAGIGGPQSAASTFDTAASGGGGGGGGSSSAAQALEWQKLLSSESGPQDWLKYWFNSRGYETPKGAEAVPMSMAIPPWAQTGSATTAPATTTTAPAPVTYPSQPAATGPSVGGGGGAPGTGTGPALAAMAPQQWGNAATQPSTPGPNPQALAFSDNKLMPPWAMAAQG